ncbi:MAG: GNAT family N-acetyltransferase [Anaerolineae bacterium]|nr:GNAT family N-acetyltransferase [Anaerolineae bacterium]
MEPSTESIRVKRLVGLCKVWGVVKYFHPYLAYRHDIDWDAALVAAIPQVNAVKDAAEYATAVQGMLAALDDPVTRVIQQEPATATTPPHEKQPSYTVTPDGILVISINYYDDLSDFFGAAQKLDTIKAEIPKARGMLFDLRAATPSSSDMGDLQFMFRNSEIASTLSTTPLVTAGERTRMHLGLAPQISGMGFPYTAAFQITDGRQILPAPEARELPVVFLINGWSELPPEALALQIAGKAAIIVEGDASDASLGVQTYLITLSDGVSAEIRLGELISEDGAGGFFPDQVITPVASSSTDDPALTASLKLLRDFKLNPPQRTPLPAHAVPAPDNAYPEMMFPSLEYRLLAVFRIWNAIQYFFPYKDLIEEDWDDVLREFIPRMEQADSDLSYHMAVAEMVTHIHDSHGFVRSPVLWELFGPAWPPIRLQIIENMPVITLMLDEEIARPAGICYGDVVLKIDGEDALERIADCAKYRAASTPKNLMYQAAWASLSGPEGSLITLTVRDRDNVVKDVRLPRKAEYAELYGLPQRSGDVTMLLTEDIGYADLDRLEVSEVDEMFEKFKNTQAIIFDMRGFPRRTMFAIPPRLTERKEVKVALGQQPCVMTPDRSWNVSRTWVQSISSTGKWTYKGKTVMLIDERAISQAEHTGLFFEAANGTKFIGSHTADTNGDITNLTVPGDIMIMFTGQAVRHADGRQLQRIGLVPDIEVRLTIAGIQNRKDEVLESAIHYLQCEIEKSQSHPIASKPEVDIVIKPFQWEDWYVMWKLNAYHLAELGIIIDDADQGPPDFNLPYDESNPNYPEMDMAWIDEAYLKGRGNFWIAWSDDQPLGHVGAQDCGDYIELRRMYVRAEYRRRGVGTLLVQALIEHCKRQKVSEIKVWTADDGLGRLLYAKCGFRQIALSDAERAHKRAVEGEIRMCLELR